MVFVVANCNFYYSLLGIETDDLLAPDFQKNLYCNFYYSLLGIETETQSTQWKVVGLQFLLLPIRDWNGNPVPISDAGGIAISITPY